jgi:hypothetical protein
LVSSDATIIKDCFSFAVVGNPNCNLSIEKIDASQGLILFWTHSELSFICCGSADSFGSFC